MFKVVRTFFHQFFHNARRSRARVDALAWVRVGVRGWGLGLGVGVGVGVRVRVGWVDPLSRFDKKKQPHKKIA